MMRSSFQPSARSFRIAASQLGAQRPEVGAGRPGSEGDRTALSGALGSTQCPPDTVFVWTVSSLSLADDNAEAQRG